MINVSQNFKILIPEDEYLKVFCQNCDNLSDKLIKELKKISNKQIEKENFIFPNFWKSFKKNYELDIRNIKILTEDMINIVNNKKYSLISKYYEEKNKEIISEIKTKFFIDCVTIFHRVLWNNDYILYPLGTPYHVKLKPARSVLEKIFDTDTEITKIINNYDGKNNLKAKHQIRRIILSTNWKNESEIEINDILACSKKLLQNFQGYLTYTYQILNHILLETKSNKIDEFYSLKKNLKYLKQINLSYDENDTSHINLYDYFLSEAKNIKESSKHKTHISRQNSFSRLNRNRAGSYEPRFTVKKQMSLIYDKFENSVNINEKIELMTSYFVASKKLQRPFTDNKTDFFNAYPGFPISNVKLKPWILAYNLWVKQRVVVERKESVETVKTAYHSFLEYIFIYISWHNIIYPKNTIKQPSSPHEVTRFPYIANYENDENNFLTFVMFLKMKKNTANTIKGQFLKLKHFFYFIETLNGQYSEISCKNFKSPVSEIDSPKGYKYAHTTKMPLPSDAYRGILQFLYTMIFCMKSYNSNILNNRFFRFHTFNKEYLTPDDLGFTPVLYKDNKVIPLNKIKNFLSVTQYSINHSIITLGHIGPAVLLLATLETGQRVQNIQWLDINSFDPPKQPLEKSHSISILHINTDKTRDEEFDTFIPKNTMDILRQFKNFQKLRTDSKNNKEIYYENRKNSRFKKICPLFRGIKTNPINDETCNNFWQRLLISYENIHKMIFNTKFESTFTDINDNLQMIYTPHAIRATVIKDLNTVMPLSSVCQIVGHTHISSTEYYAANTLEELSNKIYSERLILDTGNSSSKFISDIETDLSKAINDYGCCTISINHILNQPKNALDAIKIHGLDRIDSQPTHYCLVNSNCPHDIVTALGGRRLCGMCPLSLKCIDHLPAISAKLKVLVEKIHWLQNHASMIYETRGNSSATLEIENNISILTTELYSWAYTEAILIDIYKKRKEDYNNNFLTFNPEIVKKLIDIIKIDNPEASFFYNRIMDSEIYPEFSSENIQSKALLFAKKYRSNISELKIDKKSPNQFVKIAASQLKQIIKRTGMTINDLLNESKSSNHPLLPTLKLSIDE